MLLVLGFRAVMAVYAHDARLAQAAGFLGGAAAPPVRHRARDLPAAALLALATALDGAAALDSFLAVLNTPLAKASECALVAALATHMTLGLRILAIELLDIRERTVAVLTVCAAAVFAVGAAFLLNAA